METRRLKSHLSWCIGFTLLAAYSNCNTLSACQNILDRTQTSIETVENRQASFSQRIDQVLDAIHLGPQVALAGDADFHRRIYLDLLGRGPTVEETESYLNQINVGAAPTQVRAALIDDLLASDEFSRYYAKVLEVMFTERRESIGVLEVRALIYKWLDAGRPLNELCTEMLAADGTGEELRAAASFILNRNAETNLVTRDVGRIFFGRDVQCAQCHDHPLVADYEQSEYFGILSFVNRTYVFQDERRGNKQFLGEKGEGALEFASVFKPESGKTVAQPVLPMAMAMDAEPDFIDSFDAYLVAPEKGKRGVPRYSRRQQLAVLATHPENQSFNRNLANRLWAHMLGRGVVDPVDMHHSDNPPTSAALLRLLADELINCQYDLREFLRQIARSNAYQKSVILPNLQDWNGPSGGVDALNAELTRLDSEIQKLAPQMEQLRLHLGQSNKQLEKSQVDVAKLQAQGETAKLQLQQFSEQREKELTKLSELKSKQTKQLKLIETFQAAMKESDKLLQLTPEDQELVAARTLMNTRLSSATEAKPAIDSEVQEQEEAIEKANFRVDDQRSHILSLANRRLAFGEFVVEARGVQRGVRKQMQALVDAQTDCEQQKARIAILREWLVLRNQLLLMPPDANDSSKTAMQSKFELQQAELIESWRRCFAIRQVRGLNPEQMAGATYTALEMYRPIRAKALSDWETTHQDNPAQLADVKNRQVFVATAVTGNLWDTVEDLIVTRFSAPPGAPQDGFFATVDQALTIQNEPTYQNWLKANDGSLIQRLMAIDDSAQLASQLYLSVLCRSPETDETKMVADLLSQYSAERASIIQELVWGLLASTEFRFSI
jgi:Protein of unknown function (DUF1549)/Protein of unknown function (DUF1553)